MKKGLYLILVSVLYISSCAQKNKSIESTISNYSNLSAKNFSQKMAASQHKQVLDVRTPEETKSGLLIGAENIDFNAPDFEKKIDALDKSKTYFVYCKGGGRSSQAMATMKSKGFAEVYNLEGGIMAWNNANLPTSTKANNTKLKDEMSSEQFQYLISNHPIVVVDFCAKWCNPCRRMQPILEQLATSYKGKATIKRIDVDENPTLTKNMKVQGLPLIQIYHNGQLQEAINKEMDQKSLETLLKKYI